MRGCWVLCAGCAEGLEKTRLQYFTLYRNYPKGGVNLYVGQNKNGGAFLYPTAYAFSVESPKRKRSSLGVKVQIKMGNLLFM